MNRKLSRPENPSVAYRISFHLISLSSSLHFYSFRTFASAFSSISSSFFLFFFLPSNIHCARCPRNHRLHPLNIIIARRVLSIHDYFVQVANSLELSAFIRSRNDFIVANDYILKEIVSRTKYSYIMCVVYSFAVQNFVQTCKNRQPNDDSFAKS